MTPACCRAPSPLWRPWRGSACATTTCASAASGHCKGPADFFPDISWIPPSPSTVLGALAGFIVLGMLKGMIKMLLFGAAVLSAVAAYFWLSKYGFTYLSFITSDPREWMVSVLSIGGALAVFFVFMHGLFWFSDVFSWGRRMGFGGAKGVVTTLLMAAVVCWVGVMCIFYYGSMAEMTRAGNWPVPHGPDPRHLATHHLHRQEGRHGQPPSGVAGEGLSGTRPGTALPGQDDRLPGDASARNSPTSAAPSLTATCPAPESPAAC